MDISLENIVLSRLKADERTTLNSALRREIRKTSETIKNRDLGGKLGEFADRMTSGDDGVIEAATFLSKVCFGNSKVDEKEYTFRADANGAFWAPVGEAMSKFGFAIVLDYLDGQELDSLREAVDQVERGYKAFENSTENIDAANYYLRGDNSGSKLQGYKACAEYPKAVIMGRRTSYDNGIVDVYNFDYMSAWLTEFSDRRMRQTEMTEAFCRLGVVYEPKNLNYYLNDNTENKAGYSTRDFHYDGIIMAKNFLYLTDVPDDSYGPYTFIPKTHKKSILHTINGAIAPDMGWHSTDLKIIDRSTAVKCLASAGTMILSSQAGAHRGITQEPGRRRALLTQAYFQSGNAASPTLSRPALAAA